MPASRVVAIVQARMGSTRLPGKVLGDLAGRPVLAHIIERLRRATRVASLVVATSTAGGDEPIAALCASLGVPCHRGSEDDVLARFAGAAREAGAEAIVRITADCPLVDPAVVDAVVERFQRGDVSYASNVLPPTFPDGLDVEVFSRAALETAAAEATLRSDREHVTPFIWSRPERFPRACVERSPSLEHLRLTLDHPEDLALIRAIHESLGPGPFGLDDVVALLARRPDLAALNARFSRNEGYARSLAADRAAAPRWQVVVDPAHGYRRIDPVPTQAEVERHYAQEFYTGEYARFNDSSLEVQEREAAWLALHFADIAETIRAHFGPGRAVHALDLGCGFAKSLEHLATHGIAGTGLEPVEEAVRHARARGLDVLQGGIDELERLGGRRFDVVLLLNVLEHLRDPVGTLRAVRERALAPGGLLVVRVPNEFNAFQTAADAEHGLKQWWVVPPTHVSYFSASSLQRVARACGYRTVLAEGSFPLEMFLLMGDVYVGGPPEVGRGCHQRRVRFEQTLARQGKNAERRALYQHLAALDLGREVTLYATPNQESGP